VKATRRGPRWTGPSGNSRPRATIVWRMCGVYARDVTDDKAERGLPARGTEPIVELQHRIAMGATWFRRG
jgi:hypothetical protein